MIGCLFVSMWTVVVYAGDCTCVISRIVVCLVDAFGWLLIVYFVGSY